MLTSMKFTITHVQRAPIKEKKKVLCLRSRFSAVTGLMHPDYFTAKPDRRDKGQKKGSVGKRKQPASERFMWSLYNFIRKRGVGGGD